MAGLAVVAPETVAGADLGIVAVEGAGAGLGIVAEADLGIVVGAGLGIVAGVVPETAVAGEAEGHLGTAVEEADLETAVVADPGIVEEVEADSGTVAAVDIVAD